MSESQEACDFMDVAADVGKKDVDLTELKLPEDSTTQPGGVSAPEQVVGADQQQDHGEDNGEDMSEESSTASNPRRDSNSSTDGGEDLDAQQNEDQLVTTNTTNNSLDGHDTQLTPRKKKRKPRRKNSRSKSHSRSGSRHCIPQDSTTEPSPQQPTIENDENINNTNNNTTNNTTGININVLPPDLSPPPTRGRSNAFYGTKPIPSLLHSNSDGAAIRNQTNSGRSTSPRRTTTVGYLPSQVAVPEPAHSGLSRPKMFNYWKGFSANSEDKAILSHSRRFLVGFAETIGRRPSMEDCMVVNGTYRGRGQEDYFAIFDGHGGRDAAAFAAEHLHQILAEKLKTNNAVKSLKEAFSDTHRLIAEQKITGGTTAVVALFIGKKGFIANVGDTRAVLCRDGVPLRVSLDHKPELPAETNRIRKLGGTVTTTYNSAGQATSRVNGMLAVSRALGDTPLHPYVSSDPEIHGPLNLDPQARNMFVVLACDGVWDVLSDEEATSIVAPISNPEEASRRLRDEAFARGSTDNISVMVIRCPPFDE